MKLKLPGHLARKLLALPESGMGYQNVIVKFADGMVLETYVQNCEILELPDEPRYVQEIEDINLR